MFDQLNIQMSVYMCSCAVFAVAVRSADICHMLTLQDLCLDPSRDATLQHIYECYQECMAVDICTAQECSLSCWCARALCEYHVRHFLVGVAMRCVV